MRSGIESWVPTLKALTLTLNFTIQMILRAHFSSYLLVSTMHRTWWFGRVVFIGGYFMDH